MSETLIPTFGMRWVMREHKEPIFAGSEISRVTQIKVLQQHFKTTNGNDVWKEVPLTLEDVSVPSKDAQT